MKQKNLIRFIIPTLIFLAVIAAMVMVYVNSRAKSVDEKTAGNKTITVLVAIPEKETKEYVIETDATYLRQALDQIHLIEGEEGEFGFYITEVDNTLADDNKREWWCITKRGEEVFYGVNEIAIQDGEQYEITLSVY